ARLDVDSGSGIGPIPIEVLEPAAFDVDAAGGEDLDGGQPGVQAFEGDAADRHVVVGAGGDDDGVGAADQDAGELLGLDRDALGDGDGAEPARIEDIDLAA